MAGVESENGDEAKMTQKRKIGLQSKHAVDVNCDGGMGEVGILDVYFASISLHWFNAPLLRARCPIIQTSFVLIAVNYRSR